MQIKTTHNGHEITYSDNSDLWCCYDLNLEANTLSALKLKINKVEADARRVDNLAVIQLSRGWSGPKTATLTMIDAEGMTYDRKPAGWVNSHEDTGYRGRGNQRATKLTRKKVPLEDLILDTPENRALLDTHQKTTERLRAEQKAADEIIAAIPRLVHLAPKAETPK